MTLKEKINYFVHCSVYDNFYKPVRDCTFGVMRNWPYGCWNPVYSVTGNIVGNSIIEKLKTYDFKRQN
jgi:hypothetical protein